MSISDTIAEVLRLDAAAFDGPWATASDLCDQHDDCHTVMAGGYRVAEHIDKEEAALIAHYRTAAPELAREVQRLRAALERIVEGMPACNDGGFYVEHHDCDGNYLGAEQVDPVSVCQSMYAIGREAIEHKEPA